MLTLCFKWVAFRHILHWLVLIYISEQPNLLLAAYFHTSLEQVANDDEMLNFICRAWTGLPDVLEVERRCSRAASDMTPQMPTASTGAILCMMCRALTRWRVG